MDRLTQDLVEGLKRHSLLHLHLMSGVPKPTIHDLREGSCADTSSANFRRLEQAIQQLDAGVVPTKNSAALASLAPAPGKAAPKRRNTSATASKRGASSVKGTAKASAGK